MSDPVEPIENHLHLVAAADALLAVVRPFTDATANYRDECIAAGFSPTVAEQMSLSFYSTCMAMLMKNMMAPPS